MKHGHNGFRAQSDFIIHPPSSFQNRGDDPRYLQISVLVLVY
ncbi:MAG: hypothetical protein AAB676_06795 [Verrucomicrobiota bacterium]